MEGISNFINEFLSIPGVQIALGVLSVVYGVMRIISATSIGKKSIKKLEAKFSKAENYYNVMEQEHNEIVIQKDKQIAEIKNYYELKLNFVIKYAKDNFTALKTALSKINNVQVKNELDKTDLTFPPFSVSKEVERIKEETKNEYEQKIREIVYEELKNGREEKVDNNPIKE